MYGGKRAAWVFIVFRQSPCEVCFIRKFVWGKDLVYPYCFLYYNVMMMLVSKREMRCNWVPRYDPNGLSCFGTNLH